MKIVTILGTRPQFIKSCLLSNELKKNNINEIIIHTGQHYDSNMSEIFFKKLNLKEPNYYLQITKKAHGPMTAQMMEKIDAILHKEKPTAIIVYGDCNTTLAGALVASKEHIPIIHVESGLRSFDKKMPEEINRVLVDHISDLLFCPCKKGITNLEKEGINSNKIHLTGDLMVDLLRSKNKLINEICFYKKYASSKNYYLATIHRQSNTEHIKLREIIKKFGNQVFDIIFCLHPRTKKAIDKYNIKIPENVKCIEPVGFLDMMNLLSHSRALFTDSGGLQKEAYELKIPCFTIRENTEWTELVNSGWNQLGFPDNAELEIKKMKKSRHPIFYKNKTAQKIVQIIKNNII